MASGLNTRAPDFATVPNDRFRRRLSPHGHADRLGHLAEGRVLQVVLHLERPPLRRAGRGRSAGFGQVHVEPLELPLDARHLGMPAGKSPHAPPA